MTNSERYTLVKANKAEVWILVDNKEHIQITFKENEFHETQEVEYLEACKLNRYPVDTLKIARTLRSMFNYLASNYRYIV